MTKTTTLPAVEIDLCRYVTAARRGYYYGSSSEPALTDFRTGQKAAREKDVKKLVGVPVCLIVPNAFGWASPEFLSGFLRPLIRKQGLDDTVKFVTSCHDRMRDSLAEFFAKEDLRARERAEKKAKEEGLGDWSDPVAFFVPDIGTVVRLKEDWTFRLHSESRNHDVFEMLGIEYSPRYGYYTTGGRSKGSPASVEELTFKAGTVLKVDRVYIRKGAKEYSSITFNVQKGDGSVAVVGKREHVFKKKGVRFWAKLRDVNKMVVQVDQATLAEN